MKGTVEKYGAGWRYRVEIGRDAGTGRRRYATKAGFKTSAAARKALNKVLVDVDEGRHVEKVRQSVGDYLDEWIERAEADLRPTTAASYRRAIKKLTSLVGAVQVQELTPLMIESAYASMRKAGLAPKTILNTHTVLRKALGDAERLGVVQRNPARAARPPRVPRVEQSTWTAEQLSEFLNGISDDPTFPIYLLCATTGMRRGEVLGLRWTDVDIDRGGWLVVLGPDERPCRFGVQ